MHQWLEHIHRNPLMAMMLMVKNVKNIGMTDYDPEVG